MQYWRFLVHPGLAPVSRYQLGLAILMFIGSPAWMAILVLTALLFFFADPSVRFMRADAGIALFIWTL
jgi:membrane glycosyltransferase